MPTLSRYAIISMTMRKWREEVPRRRDLRPVLMEELGPRVLFSTLVVNSAGDDVIAGDGRVTLREAIVAANTDTGTDLGAMGSGVDTIVFDDSLHGQTITLGNGSLNIRDGLIIQGPGSQDLTIDGGNRTLIFAVSDQDFESAFDASISGLTLTNGIGAIGTAENLTITDVSI